MNIGDFIPILEGMSSRDPSCPPSKSVSPGTHRRQKSGETLEIKKFDLNDRLVKILVDEKENNIVHYETKKDDSLDYSRSQKLPSSNSFVRDSNIKQEVPILDLTEQVKSEDINPETINPTTCRNEMQEDDREFFNMTLRS